MESSSDPKQGGLDGSKASEFKVMLLLKAKKQIKTKSSCGILGERGVWALFEMDSAQLPSEDEINFNHFSRTEGSG